MGGWIQATGQVGAYDFDIKEDLTDLHADHDAEIWLAFDTQAQLPVTMRPRRALTPESATSYGNLQVHIDAFPVELTSDRDGIEQITENTRLNIAFTVVEPAALQ
ncbi:hypothetical protein [Actibacterium sp. 188UL27-1]|uniref:hypothetical protein n=1 Tax=Actibacterium sp. 188UL27-1 TaxID=2786961 RepID=UPI001957B8E5|nr:hypothetical protein [Actibacterium sp. 188UL27-1]